MKEKNKLVAVYGSLRQGMHNHCVLGNSEYIGTFNSEPIFTMYNVNNQYPAVINKGCDSITIEVFNVNKDIQKKLDNLEGYSSDFNKSYNYYNKETIETPYGKAFIYYFNHDYSSLEKIESGDWSSWIKAQEKQNNINIYNEWGY